MDQLVPLNLPPYPFRIVEVNGKLCMFDIIRKRSVIITPEEWVRQHFVQYLINQKNYPRGLIMLESGHKFAGKAKRTDILIFNGAGEKVMLVECKAPSVAISKQTLEQVARYNMVHNVPIITVTNGMDSYSFKIDFSLGTFHPLTEVPEYGAVI